MKSNIGDLSLLIFLQIFIEKLSILIIYKSLSCRILRHLKLENLSWWILYAEFIKNNHVDKNKTKLIYS